MRATHGPAQHAGAQGIVPREGGREERAGGEGSKGEVGNKGGDT